MFNRIQNHIVAQNWNIIIVKLYYIVKLHIFFLTQVSYIDSYNCFHFKWNSYIFGFFVVLWQEHLIYEWETQVFHSEDITWEVMRNFSFPIRPICTLFPLIHSFMYYATRFSVLQRNETYLNYWYVPCYTLDLHLLFCSMSTKCRACSTDTPQKSSENGILQKFVICMREASKFCWETTTTVLFRLVFSS